MRYAACLQGWVKHLSQLVNARLIRCTVVLATLVLCSCTRTIHVTHSDIEENPNQLGDIFNTVVVVQSPPSSERDHYKSGGVVAAGIQNRWDIDYASTTPQAVMEVLQQRFSNVTIENAYKPSCDHCGMIVRPKVTEFKVNKLTMQSTIELDLQIFNAYGEHVTTFHHKGKSPVMSLGRVGAVAASYFVPFSSTVLGKPVVSATVKGAIDDALEDVAERFVTESRVGGALARVWRPKKQQYGEHEYVAESIARRMGCNLRTDGLQLVSSEYGKETYDAYCYEPGRFKISCELGRCQADTQPKPSIASQRDKFVEPVN